MKTWRREDCLPAVKGFTLFEIVVVLIILCILVAVAIPKYFGLPEDAADSTLRSAVAELNAREKLAWAKWKVDPDEPVDVGEIKDLKNFTVTGGDGNYQIIFDKHQRKANVARTPPSAEKAGYWELTGL